jgi:hypothetical protein
MLQRFVRRFMWQNKKELGLTKITCFGEGGGTLFFLLAQQCFVRVPNGCGRLLVLLLLHPRLVASGPNI